MQAYGDYPQNEEEKLNFEKKSKVILHGSQTPYGEAVTSFYEDVKSFIARAPEKYRHVVDLASVFDNVPGAYRDHRHQSEIGVEHLASEIERVVLPLL